MNKVTIVRVDGSEEELDHRLSLKEAQEIVGGYIELVRIFNPFRTLVVNEDGKAMGLPINSKASSMHHGFIVGNVVVLEGYTTVG